MADQRAEWRAGTGALGRILYRDGQAVGMVDTPEIAAEIVDGLNRRRLPGLAAAAGAQVCTCPGVDGVHVIGVGGCAPESGRERSPDLWPAARAKAIAEAVDATKDCTCGPYGGCDG